MSANEFAFLALGLLLGLATGAALLGVLRARPTSPRQVRITVTPDSVPRRGPSTLAGLALAHGPAAGGGPADPATLAAVASQTLTRPGSPFALTPVLRASGDGRAMGTSVPIDGERSGDSVAVPVHGDRDLDLRTMLEPGASGVSLAARLVPATPPARDGLSASRPLAFPDGTASGSPARVAVAGGVRPGASASGSDSPRASAQGDAGEASGEVGSAPLATGADNPQRGEAGLAGGRPVGDASDPCLDARRAVDERCGLAERLRGLASAAETSLREQQRIYDEHVQQAEAAERAVDPRSLRAAKEAARDAFRRAHAVAADRTAVDAAAREWLSEINRINGDARTATATLQRERQMAARSGPQLERLVVEADAARINAEAANEACLAAREALAACEEASAKPAVRRSGPRQASGAALPGAADRARRPLPAGLGAAGDRLAGDLDEGGERLELTATDERPPAMIRLLRGDRSTLLTLVGMLAAEDPREQRHWQLLLTDLVDGIVARAIEAGCLDHPSDHPFWGMFTREQDREIGRALASLGYRFDGMGGFADGRVPGQRDLSLAIGFAALDPMRIRRWPTEAEMPDLLREVSVAADEYLAAEAGGLTLGELVALLGGRADGLADLWNSWGRVRPLLLDTL